MSALPIWLFIFGLIAVAECYLLARLIGRSAS